MVRILAVLAITWPAIASAHPPPMPTDPPMPRTWIGCDEVIGGLVADRHWVAYGVGLGFARLVGPVALGIEGHVLRLDSNDGAGFMGELVARVDYGFRFYRKRDTDLLFAPELGVIASVVYGAGPAQRTHDGPFAGLRLIMRANPSAADGPGAARGIGAHVGVRVATDRVLFVVGFDWGR
jgi:hypothetical protein